MDTSVSTQQSQARIPALRAFRFQLPPGIPAMRWTNAGQSLARPVAVDLGNVAYLDSSALGTCCATRPLRQDRLPGQRRGGVGRCSTSPTFGIALPDRVTVAEYGLKILILVVDDNPDDLFLIRRDLLCPGPPRRWCQHGPGSARSLAGPGRPDDRRSACPAWTASSCSDQTVRCPDRRQLDPDRWYSRQPRRGHPDARSRRRRYPTSAQARHPARCCAKPARGDLRLRGP